VIGAFQKESEFEREGGALLQEGNEGSNEEKKFPNRRLADRSREFIRRSRNAEQGAVLL